MLQVRNISAFYGKIQALWDVSLEVREREVVILVGANGAGKTTLLNTVSGVICPASGRIEFIGRRIDGQSVASIVEQGISHVPQGGRLFLDMTVRENLEMGAYLSKAWKQRDENLQYVYHLFPILKEREKQVVMTLSGGEKQMVAIGRGIMSAPKLCIFDEPTYGLAPMLVLEIFRVIKSLREQGITLLVVEQNVKQSLEIGDRAYVLENGRIVLDGIGSELLQNDYMRKAYLGI